jgi:hypothetical protein
MCTSLTITEKYPENKYNLLIPMKTVAEIADIHRPVMNEVYISTNLNDNEIYLQKAAQAAYNGFPATPDKYALTAKGLTKLMRAAGIQMVYRKSILPSTCQKCREVNMVLGVQIQCHKCDNKDVKCECCISMPQLSGENLHIVAEKELIYAEEIAIMKKPKQIEEFTKFRTEHCATKALNRALRAAMQIKSTYLSEEFKKPFIVAYLVPNLDNADVKEAAIKNMFCSADNLFGKTRTYRDISLPGEAQNTLNISENISENMPGIIDPPFDGSDVGYYNEYPENGHEDYSGYENVTDRNEAVCSECGGVISDKVYEFSMKKYSRPLCYTCQKAQGGGK